MEILVWTYSKKCAAAELFGWPPKSDMIYALQRPLGMQERRRGWGQGRKAEAGTRQGGRRWVAEMFTKQTYWDLESAWRGGRERKENCPEPAGWQWKVPVAKLGPPVQNKRQI